MGEVWRARHRLLKRHAAVKVIRPDVLVAQPGRQAGMLRKRFEQEAQSIAALKSPHTVAVYDFGATEDGGFYYAMELLEGFDLDKLVRRFGPLPAARVAHILRQACASLEEAHFHAMIHRDIKPTNLFLCRQGTTYDFCKVLDFGLVKRCIGQDATMLSAAGNATGTPAFMAPEVATSTVVDGRVDIYGLGCVAYWLLTGCLVFDEPTPTATVIAHIQKAPVPPSIRTEIEIPAGLERIVMGCLEKDPARRPESAAALSRMLAGCDGVRPWRHEDAEAWWRINAPEAAALAAAGPATQSEA
jgi:serine/threonine-protein kinase